MSRPASREEMADWCLRQLGFPVVEINADPAQIDDCIDMAFQYFNDFHFDGIERTYLKHQITEQDKANQYIPVNDNVLGITRIFPIGYSSRRSTMWSIEYQIRLNDLWAFTSTSYTNYVITMQHLRTLDMLFSGEQPIRFNRHSNKLYIDWDWPTDVEVGEYVIIEANVVIDPDTYTKVYDDRLLKRLATAYIKRVWANNMRKFQGMQLPGGVMMNGQQMYEEAVQEIAEIEQLIRSSAEYPPQFIMG